MSNGFEDRISEQQMMKAQVAGIGGMGHGIMRTLAERTNDEIQALESQLERKRKLKKLLEENPVIEEVINLMS